ncbi:hypothetical protein SB6419_02608 [Klebsiella spallanzanii]|nr:hypothetical protein SB6419_02608 [Klebsiella spallanzanii]
MSIYPLIIAQDLQKMHLSEQGIGTILGNKSHHN